MPNPRFIRFKGMTYRLVSAAELRTEVSPPSDVYLKKLEDMRLRELAKERREQQRNRMYEDAGHLFIPSPSKQRRREWTTVSPNAPVSVKRYPEKPVKLLDSDAELLLQHAPAEHEKLKHLFSKPLSFDDMSYVLDSLYVLLDTIPFGTNEYRRINQLIMIMEREGAEPTKKLHSNLPDLRTPKTGPEQRWEPGKPLPQTLHLSYKGAVYRRVDDPFLIESLTQKVNRKVGR